MGQNIIKVRDNIFTITENLGSNDSAIVTSKGVVMFDTPHKPSDAMNWRRFVESLGPTKYIIISDHHIDHTLSGYFFKGEMISTVGTRNTLLERHPTIPFMDRVLGHFDPEGVPLIHGDYEYRIPDITVTDRMALFLGDTEIQLIHKKGHTPNNLMAYLPKEKVLFSGDNVCECGLPSSQECCLESIFDTIDYILNELDVDTIVPGHGDVTDKDGARKFRKMYMDYANEIFDRMERGDSKEKIQDELRFPDLIHCNTDRYTGYPDEMNEEFQRNSVGRIFDQLAVIGEAWRDRK